MSEPAQSSTPPDSPQPIHALVERTANGVRQNPVKSVVWAFFIGLLLTVFPVGRVFSALLHVAFSLLRPALFLLGVVKVFESVDQRKK